MKMMGMPLERLAEFRRWMNNMAAPDYAKRATAFANVETAMGELVAARRVERRDDFISRLLDSDIDGHPPSAEDMKAYCLAHPRRSRADPRIHRGSAAPICHRKHPADHRA
jgi:cytochrome P450